MVEHWVVACFEEGFPLWLGGPCWLAEAYPWLLGDRQGAWSRFLEVVSYPDTEASRRVWRRRGYRLAKVFLLVDLVDTDVDVDVGTDPDTENADA